MATLKSVTVTNGSGMTQVYLDHAGNAVAVQPGESATYQVIDDNRDVTNIPSGQNYLKLKTPSGEWAYIWPNDSKKGVKVNDRQP